MPAVEIVIRENKDNYNFTVAKEDNEVHIVYAPPADIEITEEEYNTLLAELEAKWKQESEQNAPENPYCIDDTTYNNIIDDYTSSITSEVASNGY